MIRELTEQDYMIARSALRVMFDLYNARQKPHDQLTEREALLIALHGDDDR